MDTEWLVVKFVADLRRQEPVNVGVLLHTPTGRALRFKGQRSDGSIDGRSVHHWTDTENWRGWVEYWTDCWLIDGDPIEDLLVTSPANNFHVVRGGRLLSGDGYDDTNALLDELFAVLVETPAKKQRQ